MEDEVRHITNPYPDWTAFNVQMQKSSNGRNSTKYSSTVECHKIQQKARIWLKNHIKKMHDSYPPQSDIAPSTRKITSKKQKDSSIYTGAGGNAYMHWKLSRFYSLEGDADRTLEHVLKGLQAIDTALSIPDGGGVAFYVGLTGVHALAAVLFHQYKEPSKTQHHIEQLLGYLDTSLRADTPDELLFGRAGYLSGLLFVKKHVSKDVFEKMEFDQTMRHVFLRLLESGKEMAVKDKLAQAKKFLKYTFYGQSCLGAAHGVAGILYVLLQFPEWCKEPDIKSWILGTLDHLLGFQDWHGNFPSTASGHDDRMLVHWCHGAPGVIPLLHRAYEVFEDAKFLKLMEIALECVWKYGILKKGFGICHGISGNAYPFVWLYKLTGQDEYHYKAMQMAECIFSKNIRKMVKTYCDPHRCEIGVPDTPYSLMEGLAGTVCFVCDLLHPEEAAFPGFNGDI